MISQNKLAVELSKLKTFDSSDIKLEQYQTPSDIAAKVLWWAYMQGDIMGKIIADLGCGNGIFGIGALLLDAKKVYFVDKEIKLAEENSKKGQFFRGDIKDFNKKVDTVIQNPPFGVQREHADREFLKKALKISKVIYSFHKIESENFINKFCEDNDAKAKKIFVFDFPLKKTQRFHKKELYKFKVGVWQIRKINK